jgi:hypothetical protein
MKILVTATPFGVPNPEPHEYLEDEDVELAFDTLGRTLTED